MVNVGQDANIADGLGPLVERRHLRRRDWRHADSGGARPGKARQTGSTINYGASRRSNNVPAAVGRAFRGLVGGALDLQHTICRRIRVGHGPARSKLLRLRPSQLGRDPTSPSVAFLPTVPTVRYVQRAHCGLPATSGGRVRRPARARCRSAAAFAPLL